MAVRKGDVAAHPGVAETDDGDFPGGADIVFAGLVAADVGGYPPERLAVAVGPDNLLRWKEKPVELVGRLPPAVREIRRFRNRQVIVDSVTEFPLAPVGGDSIPVKIERFDICLLYTSDAADEL